MAEVQHLLDGLSFGESLRWHQDCFSCALGGTNRTTLFMVATHWRGTKRMTDKSRTGVGPNRTQHFFLVRPDQPVLELPQVSRQSAAGWWHSAAPAKVPSTSWRSAGGRFPNAPS